MAKLRVLVAEDAQFMREAYKNGLFRPNLTLQVAHLAQGSLDMITIP